MAPSALHQGGPASSQRSLRSLTRPPSAQRLPEPQVVLRVLLNLSRLIPHWGLVGGLLDFRRHLVPLDEHKQSREHEATSKAETEAEPERKGERIASVANVVGGRECWR